MSVNDLVVASGRVQNRKLYIKGRRAFDQQIAQMDERWVLDITVQRRRATRSHAQNAFYWSVVIGHISEHTGYSPDETHDACKALFLPRKLAMQDGNGEVVNELVIGGSTRRLNKLEFGEYIERIRQWAAETLDLNIPDPEAL